MVYEKVRDYCSKKKISVRQFEIMCGLGNGTVGKWKTQFPKLGTIERIAKGTGTSVRRWV